PADGSLKCDPNAARSCLKSYYCDAQTSRCFRNGHTPVIGRACSSTSDCAGGPCVDGLCCDSACDGVCEACNIPGAQGTCTPVPANTDPDNDCAAKQVIDNPGINSPPGGVFTSVAACAGKCSGQRSCTYPGMETSCGQNFCNDATTVA